MKTALILQGGGASGSWQAGVLEALFINSNAFVNSVKSVVGTSVGGLNGALLVQRLNNLASQNQVQVPTHSEVWQQRISWRILKQRNLQSLIRETIVPQILTTGPTYLVLPTSVVKGRIRAWTIRTDYDMLGQRDRGLHVFQFGPTHSSPADEVITALIGTSAIPWIYGPISFQDLWLSDGGLLANLPADIVNSLAVDAFVVVSPKSPGEKLSRIPLLRTIEVKMRERLSRLVSITRRRINSPTVYHLHPGHQNFRPPGILNFNPDHARRSFDMGFQFGLTLNNWNSRTLSQFEVTS